MVKLLWATLGKTNCGLKQEFDGPHFFEFFENSNIFERFQLFDEVS